MRRICCRSAVVAPAAFMRLASSGTREVIGISLGTTNACVAAMDGDAPRVLECPDGLRTTPAYVAFKQGCEERLVGAAAKRTAVVNPSSTFFAVKRLIGRRFDDPATQQAIKALPYRVVRRGNGDAWVEDGDGRQHSPSAVSAIVLLKMKQTAEARLQRPVTDVVLTAPVNFDDAQRQAIRDAGAMAGLNVARVINEPSAAALAYGMATRTDCTIAVYDFGGATFNITVMDVESGVCVVRAFNGDDHLGGGDFDAAIAQHIVDEFKSTTGIDLSNEPKAMQRVREAAEKAKCELSSAAQADISIPFIIVADTLGTGDARHDVRTTLSRSTVESLVDGLVRRSLASCEQCLKDAGIGTGRLDEVLLVGGMCRMPKVVEAVRSFFGKEPLRGNYPDEAAAMGAALLGSMLRG